MVESTRGHRENRQRRSTMEFKVRWTGFGEACDSWEPYKALFHVDKLNDYLRANTCFQMNTSSATLLSLYYGSICLPLTFWIISNVTLTQTGIASHRCLPLCPRICLLFDTKSIRCCLCYCVRGLSCPVGSAFVLYP